jgi:hypothetical protein
MDLQMKQSEFVTFSKTLEFVLKFAPSIISFKERTLFADSALGDVCIRVAVPEAILEPEIEFHLGGNLSLIKDLKHIRGGLSTSLHQEGKGYRFSGDHFEVHLDGAETRLDHSSLLDKIVLLGSPLASYDSRHLKRFLGNGNDVLLAAWDDQIEQIAPAVANSPFTFTGDMKEELDGKMPELLLRSKAAFHWMAEDHQFQLGRIGSDYIIKAENKVDAMTNVEVFEGLTRLVA